MYSQEGTTWRKKKDRKLQLKLWFNEEEGQGELVFKKKKTTIKRTI